MNQPTVTQYLISRLAQLGATEFFGVAGGLNANICTAIEASKEHRKRQVLHCAYNSAN